MIERKGSYLSKGDVSTLQPVEKYMQRREPKGRLPFFEVERISGRKTTV